MTKVRQGKGIALIQVLLITGILSVLVLYFSQTSRQQVQLAQLGIDRAQALVRLHDAESLLYFELLTRTKMPGEALSEQGLPWNFYAKPFEVMPGVTAVIQDQAGLLSAQFVDCEAITPFLRYQGWQDEQIVGYCDDVNDWQDLDLTTKAHEAESERFGTMARNGKMVDISDLLYLPSVDIDAYSKLKEVLTLHFVGSFNPMTAPEALLKTLMPEEVVPLVTQMREQGIMDKQAFSAATGIRESEEIWFNPSNFIELKLTSEQGNVRLTKSWVLKVDPLLTLDPPINIIENRG